MGELTRECLHDFVLLGNFPGEGPGIRVGICELPVAHDGPCRYTRQGGRVFVQGEVSRA